MSKSRIYPESENSLRVMWGFCSFGFCTIAYYLSGILIGVNWTGHSTISSLDWIKLLVLWFLLQIIRMIVVFVLSPLLKKFGYGINRQELFITCFSSVKGGLNLTLSIMVMVDWVLPQRIKELTIFLTSGIVILTHLINGSAARFLINYFEVEGEPLIKKTILKN